MLLRACRWLPRHFAMLLYYATLLQPLILRCHELFFAMFTSAYRHALPFAAADYFALLFCLHKMFHDGCFCLCVVTIRFAVSLRRLILLRSIFLFAYITLDDTPLMPLLPILIFLIYFTLLFISLIDFPSAI